MLPIMPERTNADRAKARMPNLPLLILPLLFATVALPSPTRAATPAPGSEQTPDTPPSPAPQPAQPPPNSQSAPPAAQPTRAPDKLIGVAIPARAYFPRDHIKIPGPWHAPITLSFNTFLNPAMSGPVHLTIEEDESGHLPSSSQFLASARTLGNMTVLVWKSLTLPNGRIAWMAPRAPQQRVATRQRR